MNWVFADLLGFGLPVFIVLVAIGLWLVYFYRNFIEVESNNVFKAG